MAALRNDSKCSHTTCMLRFFTVSRLALNPNLIFEIGSNDNVPVGNGILAPPIFLEMILC